MVPMLKGGLLTLVRSLESIVPLAYALSPSRSPGLCQYVEGCKSIV